MVPAVKGAVVEVGPAIIRRVSPDPEVRVDEGLAATALAGIDDTTVLLDERPVGVVMLWHNVIASVLGLHRESVTIVHPSWWPEPRVARVVDAAGRIAGEVVAVPRSRLLARRVPEPATVIEIADHLIAVAGHGELVTVPGPARDCEAVAEVAMSVGGPAAQVLIDTADGIADADNIAGAVRTALIRRGVSAVSARIDDALLGSPQPEPISASGRRAPAHRRWRRVSPQVVAAASVAAVMCGVGLASARPRTVAPAVTADATSLVEGRIAVRIPAHWDVERITAGPGSRRVRVTSPVDPDAALHITASYVPGEMSSATAHVLWQAIARQPAGVFVDFRPSDQRGARPAVTYREVRVGRNIRWSVVLDGSMRISIGCQSAPGREDTIREACDEAVRSARDLHGTDAAP